MHEFMVGKVGQHLPTWLKDRLRPPVHRLGDWKRRLEASKRASGLLFGGELGMHELALAEKIELVRLEYRRALLEQPPDPGIFNRFGFNSWNYHSRASIDHRYVVMTVPKVACTTIKMALHTWDGRAPEPERWRDVHHDLTGRTLLAYPTAQIVEMLRSPDYLRFAFVRNPFSRLV